MKKYLAEMVGTMVLVLMGCGVAVSLGCTSTGEILTGNMSTVIGTAMAFGLAVVAMAYAIGGISGCHINPAITLGVWLSKRMSGKDAVMYMLFQVIGAFIGSAILYALTCTVGPNPEAAAAVPDSLACGTDSLIGGTGANTLQPNVMWWVGLVAEVVFTFIFVLVVLGTTDSEKGAGNLAGLAIGLTLILVHLICIRYTGTSVNPARSIAPAVFAGGKALSQLWIFIVGPFAGAILAAGVWKCLSCNCKK